MLVVTVRSSDTKQDMINAYEQRAGITPRFPIILSSGGGRDLTLLFGQPDSPRPTWIVHPLRHFDGTEYTNPDMTDDLKAALNDTCNATGVVEKNISFNNAYSIFMVNNGLHIRAKEAGSVQMNLFSIKGETVISVARRLSPGINKITFNNNDVAKGLYIVTIKNDSEKCYNTKVLLK